MPPCEIFSKYTTSCDKVTADILYVRAIPSAEEGEIIDALCYGAEVRVTGQTDPNAADQRWFRIALNDAEGNETEGFVSAEFLADTAPAAADPVVYEPAPAEMYTAVYTVPAAAAPETVSNGYTGVSPSGAPIVKTSYVYAQSGTLVEIYKDANGTWTYGDGMGLTWVTDNEAMTEGGEAFTSYDPTNIPDLGAYLQTVAE